MQDTYNSLRTSAGISQVLKDHLPPFVEESRPGMGNSPDMQRGESFGNFFTNSSLKANSSFQANTSFSSIEKSIDAQAKSVPPSSFGAI